MAPLSSCIIPSAENVVPIILGLSHLVMLAVTYLACPQKTVSYCLKNMLWIRVWTALVFILHIYYWMLFIYRKRWVVRGIEYCLVGTGAFNMILLIISWNGLSTIHEGIMHYIFASLFMFFIVTLSVLVVMLTESMVSNAIMVVLQLVLIGCGCTMVYLFPDDQFVYIPEYIAYTTYGLAFILFFLTQPYASWDKSDKIKNCWPWKQLIAMFGPASKEPVTITPDARTAVFVPLLPGQTTGHPGGHNYMVWSFFRAQPNDLSLHSFHYSTIESPDKRYYPLVRNAPANHWPLGVVDIGP